MQYFLWEKSYKLSTSSYYQIWVHSTFVFPDGSATGTQPSGEGGTLPPKRAPPLLGEEPTRGMNFTQRTFVHVSGGMFAMIPHYSRGPVQRLPPLAIPQGPASVERETGINLPDVSTPYRASFAAYPPSTCSYAVCPYFRDKSDIKILDSKMEGKLVRFPL